MIGYDLAQHLKTLTDDSFPTLQDFLKHTNFYQVKHYLNHELSLKLLAPASEKNSRALIQLIVLSKSRSFSAFIQEIQASHPEAYKTYQCWEALIFPGLGFDKNVIFKNLDDARINAMIPPQFKTYASQIKRVKSTPMMNLVGPLSAYALGWTPFFLANLLAHQLTEATAIERFVLASAGTGLGGGLRFWSAHQVDTGFGKQAIMHLQIASLGGLCGVLALIYGQDLSKLTSHDLKYWGLLFFNALSGAGLANFSAAIPLCARGAPGDGIEAHRARVLDYTGEEPGGHCVSSILRHNAAQHIAWVGGLGGLALPGSWVLSTVLVQQLGLSEAYLISGAMMIAGLYGLSHVLEDTILGQLRHDDVPSDVARDLAAWMGQKNQVNPEISFVQKLLQLECHQITGLIVMCSNYISTFGLLLAVASTGQLTLERRGLNPSHASHVIASIISLSALVSAGMALPTWPIKSSTLTQGSLMVMAMSCLLFAFSENDAVWLSALYVFAVANGIGNYSVFDQIAKDHVEIIGLASGFSGGMGAFSAIFMCAMAGVSSDGVEQTNRAHEYALGAVICLIALMGNVLRDVLNQYSSRPGYDQIYDEEANTQELVFRTHSCSQ